MTPISLSPSSLREGRWYEYLVRFLLGGAATVFTGLISSRFGPAVGGLFLALPAIFCASATLVENHEIRRKREAGLSGERRGQEAAALDAAGAALGALGMLAFAIVFSWAASSSIPTAFVGASVAWLGVSIAAWFVRRKLRSARRVQGPKRASGPTIPPPTSKPVGGLSDLRRPM
jgi:FtsH-binding integral membrane protein